MRLNKKGFEPIMIVLLAAALLVAGGAGYYVWNRNRDKPAVATSSKIAADVATEEDSACTAPEGYTVYNNTDVRFCFVYPEEWGVASVALGVIDVTHEDGHGWLGTFSLNSNASFAFLSNDWAYTGPGRGGPNHAVGFVTYEVFAASAGDTTDYDIKFNTDSKQLVGATTDFNIQGAIVWAKRVFTESEPYTGIEFQLNAPSTGAFDMDTAAVGDFVSSEQFGQMTVVVDSVTEY